MEGCLAVNGESKVYTHAGGVHAVVSVRRMAVVAAVAVV